MGYNIDEPGIPGRTVLRPSALLRNILGGSLLIIGMVTSLAAAGKLIAGSISDGPPVIGMALLFVASAILILTQIRPPRFLVFDDAKASLLIYEDRPDRITASIPYSQISGFATARGVPSRNRDRASYGVDLEMKDGVRYALIETNTLARAEEITQKLLRRVDLNARADAPRVVSDRFDVQRAAGKTTIQWIMPQRVFRSFLFLCTFAAFALMVLESRSSVPVLLFWLIEGALSLLTILTIAHFFYPRRQILEIDENGLSIRAIGLRPHSLTIPVSQIGSVQFQFAAAWEDFIYVLTPEQTDVMRDYQAGTLDPGRMAQIAKMWVQAVRIPSGGITASDMICLEQLIQEALKKDGPL